LAVHLTDAEKAMFDGAEGPAKARAMDLLVRYGEALGAERLVETRNVTGTWNSVSPGVQAAIDRPDDFDAVFSRFNLDSDEVVATPDAAVFTCQLIHGIDPRNAHLQGFSPEVVEVQRKAEAFFGRRGVQMMGTCTPYQVGNVPVRGEHCAWMESSAVVYCNAVLGARTNTEGRESTGAASITGRIPYWGFHLPENRRANQLVQVGIEVDDMMDWGLFGYHVGEIVQDEVPVLDGPIRQPNLIKLKHFGAAGASSGGLEMYHIPGVTPEADSVEEALGGAAPAAEFSYGARERAVAYENLNSSASDRRIDFIMLGCPHNSAEQMWTIAKLLEGRKVSPDVQLWVHTPRQIRDLSDRSGYTAIIEAAGGVVMSDTCPAISRAVPKGTRVTATDSAKQAHYLPAITGVQTWFGSLRDCIGAAVSGRWEGGL
jgi:predicted aconitase